MRMKFNISKGWTAYLAFVWGLWTAIIGSVIEGMHAWNMGYTFLFTLHIMANILVLFISIVREKDSKEDEIEKKETVQK